MWGRPVAAWRPGCSATGVAANAGIGTLIMCVLADGVVTVQEIWTTAHLRECSLANSLLALPRSMVVRRGLGASDCRCPTHFLAWRGSLWQLRAIVRSWGLTPYLSP